MCRAFHASDDILILRKSRAWLSGWNRLASRWIALQWARTRAGFIRILARQSTIALFVLIKYVRICASKPRLGRADFLTQFGPQHSARLRRAYFDGAEPPAECVHSNRLLANDEHNAIVQAAYDAAHELAASVLRNVANDVPELTDMANEEQDSYIELKQYSSRAINDKTADRVQLAEHADQSLVTLLLQSPLPTSAMLQIESAEGDWFDAPPEPNCALINVGDFLEMLTHGALRSTRHRVIGTGNPNAPKTRQSLAFFAMPQWHRSIAGQQVGDLLPLY